MNRSTQAVLIALIASITFIGTNADAQEIEPPVPAPDSHFHDTEIMEFPSFHPLTCEASGLCQPETNLADSCQGADQVLRIECSLVISEAGAFAEYPDALEYDWQAYDPYGGPFIEDGPAFDLPDDIWDQEDKAWAWE